MVCLFIGTTIREHTVTIRELASHNGDYISGIFIFRWWMIMGDERDLIVKGGKYMKQKKEPLKGPLIKEKITMSET